MVFNFKGKKSGGTWETILLATTVGLQLVSATFVGLAIGYFLEKWLCGFGEKFCFKPWIMLFWLVMGIIAGFKMMYQEVRNIQKAQAKDERDGHAPDDRDDSSRPPQH